MSLTIKQIAEKLNTSDTALYYFLKTHPDIENEYREEFKGEFTGGRRPKLYKDGISFIIANVKNIQSLDLQSDIEKGKKEIAKTLIESKPSLPSTEQLLLKTVELLNQLQSKLEDSNERIAVLEGNRKHAALSYKKPTRDDLKNKISEYCKLNKLDHSTVYSRLYGEIHYRHRINIMSIANASGVSGLMVAEKRGMVEELCEIFDSMFKIKD